MDKKVEDELLSTKDLNEFRKIIIDNRIMTTKELSKEVLAHYNKLGSNQSAKDHTDPRKKEV